MAEIRTFTSEEAPAGLLEKIRRLCDEAFDGRFSDDDWDHALGGTHAVAVEMGAPVAHASVVRRPLEVGGRSLDAGYVEGVAAAPSARGRGLGSQVMKRLTGVIHAEFEMGALSTDAYHFYERLGWERWRGPSYVRKESDLTRTEDEDDGIMVLRFGPSADLDLSSSITCEARSGDDW